MKIILIAILLTLTSGIFAQSVSKKTEEKQNVKSQLIGEWKFHEITLVTPKDGYLIRISERETAMMNLLVANYTFNENGSIALDSKYKEKQGVKSASWKMDELNTLTITFFWTVEKQKKADYTNDYEKIEFNVKISSTKKLSLNLQDMFFVNLVQ